MFRLSILDQRETFLLFVCFAPKKMDAYEKGETLGQGTFGVVYKAVHKEVSRGGD